jgi:hypothetical protein
VEVLKMVNTVTRKTANRVNSARGRDRYTETSEWEAIQIPLWLLKGVISKDFDVPLRVRQSDNEKKEPLRIPSWLFKDLLRKDRDVPLTVPQVASLLGVHPKTVQRWSRLGVIKKYSVSSRGDPSFLVADVVDALVNTPELQRLFNRREDGFSKTEVNDMLQIIEALQDQQRDFMNKLRDFMAGKTNKESVEKALAQAESSARQFVALVARLESHTN